MTTYTITRVWQLLEDADKIIPWQKLFPGAPRYHTVYTYLIEHGLQEADPQLYNQLEHQIEFNNRYEREHYAELRG